MPGSAVNYTKTSRSLPRSKWLYESAYTELRQMAGGLYTRFDHPGAPVMGFWFRPKP